MAALWGLTVLLLCAANIGLAQVTPPPASTSNHTPNLHSDSQTNTTQNRPSPPVTTEKNTTKDVTTALPPAQTQCFHTVTPIPFGLQINVNFTAGNYSINLTEEGRPETRQMFNVQSSDQSSSHEIKHLKPCTRYHYEVAFINNDGNNTLCSHTEDKNGTVTTEQMREVDISTAVNKSTPGFIYFQSKWDISSSLSPPNKFQQCISETCSIKLDIEDICSNFTATFTSGNCSISVTKSITVDILNPSDIKQIVSTGLPATIEPTLPSKCNDLSVVYTCSDGKVNDSRKLSELEPFTDYTCTGLIKVNNVPSDKRTTPEHIRIDCRFRITITKREKTNTSIELTWTTTSDNCQDALPRLHNLSLSYDCSCEKIERKSSKIPGKLIRLPDGGKCSFTGLTPYTEYTCGIVPTYKNIGVGQGQSISLKTDAGKPVAIHQLNVDLPANNVIKVSCDYRGPWFGPKEIYRAHLNNEKVPDSRKCEFEFKDLSYSTSYTVEVTVFNGVLESKPKIINISTRYNDKALIGSLCFLIVIIFVVVFVVIYKIYKKKHRESRSDVNDDMMLESAIYVNTRPPGWRHKADHHFLHSSVNDDMMRESAIYVNTRPPGWNPKAAR